MESVHCIPVEAFPSPPGLDVSKAQVKIIAAIEDPKVIKKILTHLGLPASAPKLQPARGPPLSDQGDMFEQEPSPEFFEN